MLRTQNMLFVSRISYLRWVVIDILFLGLPFLWGIENKILFKSYSEWIIIIAILLFFHSISLCFSTRIILFDNYIQINFLNFFFLKRNKKYYYKDIFKIIFQNSATPNVSVAIKKGNIIKRNTHYFFYINIKDLKKITEMLKIYHIDIQSK